MKSLADHILEAFQEFNIDLKWMISKYNEFNEIYFNGELPRSSQIKLEIKALNGNALGEQGFDESWYFNRAKVKYDKYIMLKKEKEYGHSRLVQVYDPISELGAHIRLSTKYKATENQWEDTLIHEMIHLYTYKDGYAPKQAHGPEFRKICDRIRKIAKEKYNKEYELEIYARKKENYSLTDEEQKKVIEKNQRKLNRAIGIYLELTGNYFPQRFLFVSSNNLNKILKLIKSTNRNELKAIYLSDNSYEKMQKEYGDFPLFRTYRFFDMNKYPRSLNYMKVGENIINESLMEAKKEYITPEIGIIELDKNVNLSEINLEDILNSIEDDKEIKVDPEIEKDIIDA